MNIIRTVLSNFRGFSSIKNQIVGFHRASCNFPIFSISYLNNSPSPILTPTLPGLNHFRGMKVQKVAKKRCPHCYLVWKDGRVFNYCKVKPRHKHMSRAPREADRLIITHSTHGRRAW